MSIIEIEDLKFRYSKEDRAVNGVSLNIGTNYNFYSLCGGIVVYIVEKEKLGNTIIIQGTDGIDYWYSNLENISVNLYDYIEKDILLGTTKDEFIYLTFVYLNFPFLSFFKLEKE